MNPFHQFVTCVADKKKETFFSFHFLQAVLITGDGTKYVSNKTLTQENTFLRGKKISFLSLKTKQNKKCVLKASSLFSNRTKLLQKS